MNDRHKWRSIITDKMSDDDVVANIMMKISRHEEETQESRRQWIINAAFARGQQWSVLHKTEDRLIDMQSYLERRKITDDMISQWKERIIANLLMVVPVFEGVPNNYDSEQVTASRMASHLLEYYWDDWRFMVEYIKICEYVMDFGNAFGVINFIPNAKWESSPLFSPDTLEPVIDEETGDQEFYRRSYGDIILDILPPQNIACNNDDSDLDEKPWVAIVKPRSRDWYDEEYGAEKSDGIRADSSKMYDLYGLNRISRGRETDKGEVEFANCITYMQKPSKSNEKGMVAVVAGGILLERGPWPYEKLIDRYPIEHFHVRKDSGEFLARSPIERQIPLQKELNLLHSLITENADEVAHFKWLIPHQSDCDTPSDMNEVLRYTYPYKPEIPPIPPLPSYIPQQIQEVKAALRDIQSYHGASMGTSVSGVRSDIHAQNLQDQDQLPLSITDNLLSVSFGRLGEKVLIIAAEKLDDQRTLVYTDYNGRQMTVENFRGAMLGDVRKVKVKLENQYLRNKSATTQRIYEFFNAGLITDTLGRPDPVKAMMLLEFALPSATMHDFRLHSNQAYYENDRLYSGSDMRAYPWQNHDIHLRVHQEEQNSAQYMNIVEKSEGGDKQSQEAVMRFDSHIQQHSQLMAQAFAGMRPPENAKSGEGTQEAEQPVAQ